MNQHILQKTLEAFANHNNHKFDKSAITKPLAEERVYNDDEIALFVNDFILSAANIEISAKLNLLDPEQLKFAIRELTTPFLLFERQIQVGFRLFYIKINKRIQ